MSLGAGFENIKTIDQIPYDFKNALIDVKYQFNTYDIAPDEHKSFEYTKKGDDLVLKNGIGKSKTFKPEEQIIVMDERKKLVYRNSFDQIRVTDRLAFDTPTDHFNLITLKNNDPLYVPSLKSNIQLMVEHGKFDVLDYYNKKYNYSMGANIVWFDKSVQTILFKVLNYLYKYRFNVKALMGDLKREYELTKNNDILKRIATLDIIQKAFKIGLNSGYGTIGSIYFRFYNRDLANAVTASGQFVLRGMVKNTNEYFRKITKTNEDVVVYGNTDSMYFSVEKMVSRLSRLKIYDTNKALTNDLLKFYEKGIHPMFTNSFKESYDFMNVKHDYSGIKVEKIIKEGIFSAKNRYSLRIIYDEGRYYEEPKISSVGISTKNIKFPKLMSEWFKIAIDIIFNGNRKELMEYVEMRKLEFMKLPLNDIATFESVKKTGKYIKRYDSTIYSIPETKELMVKDRIIENGKYILAKGISPQLRGVAFHNHLIKRLGLVDEVENIRDGEKVKHLILKDGNNINGIDKSICYRDESQYVMDKIFSVIEKYVDKDKQFESVFLSSIEKLTKSIGWDMSEKGIENEKNIDNVLSFLDL
jgi:DNA polymerase elongation subunit (family B)